MQQEHKQIRTHLASRAHSHARTRTRALSRLLAPSNSLAPTQAREALNKETYDMIFKTSAVRAKGAAGEATRSAGGRGAMRGGGGAAGRGGASKDDEDKAKVEETLEDLHDFRDATGLWASDWVLQVCVWG